VSSPVTVSPATPAATVTPQAIGVLFATARTEADPPGLPAAALEWEAGQTLVERLAGQLRSLGIDDVRVVVRPGHELPGAEVSADAAADLRYIAALAREATGPLVIAAGEIVTQREALAGLLADPRVSTGILTTSGRIARPWGYRTKTRRGRLVSASSPYHTTADPNQTFLGVLKVDPADHARLAVLADELAALRADPPEAWTRELEFCKAGTWRLAVDRIARYAAERDAREAAEARGETYDPEAESDPEAPDEPVDMERRDPQDVELDPADAAELRRRLAAAPEEIAALLLTALVRDGAQVGNSFLRSLFWARPLSDDAVRGARATIVSYDEEAELLRSAVKASDGFFTTFLVSPLSKYVARFCARLGLDPNQVTIFSMVLGVVAAALFATGERPGLVAGGIVAYLAFFFDCVDGQLARYARKFSKLGAWLDSIFDRSKEYVIFAGLALGARHMGYEPAWVLACAALTLQTTRHAIDFAYPATQHQVIATLAHAPLASPGDGFGLNTPLWLRPPPPSLDAREEPALSPFERIWRAWRRLGRLPGVLWVKKMITFPIGERFAVIALVTALATPKTTLIVLLAWGGFAATYIVLGRLIRVLRSDTAVAPAGALRGRLESYRDDGPLTWPFAVPDAPLAWLLVAAIPLTLSVAVSARHAAFPVVWAVAFGSLSSGTIHRDRFRWLVPPALRVLEFTAIAWMGHLAGHADAAYAFLAAVCFRQYDLVYRLRHRGTEADRRVSALGLGWGGRMLLVLVLLLAGALPAGLYVAAGLLGALWVSDAARAWTTAGRPARTLAPMTQDEEEEAAG
jgi:hypothetical protein